MLIYLGQVTPAPGERRPHLQRWESSLSSVAQASRYGACSTDQGHTGQLPGWFFG